MEPMFCYRAKVRSVYDGDTVRVDLDLGLNTWVRNVPLRLWGINTPEVRGEEREEGLRVRDYVRGRLEICETLVVETKKDRKGKFGRWLAILWADGENLNEFLVQNGMAVTYMRDDT